MRNKKTISAIMMALAVFFVLQMPAISSSKSDKAIDKSSVSHNTSSALKCSGDKSAKNSKNVKDSKCGDGKCGDDKSVKVSKSDKNCEGKNCDDKGCDGKCGGGKCGDDKSAKADKSAKKSNKAEKCGTEKCA